MIAKLTRNVLLAGALLATSACTVQPLHGTVRGVTVSVDEAGDRVTQQVRNHLLYRLGPAAVDAGATRQIGLLISPVASGILTVGTDGEASNTSVRRMELTGTATVRDPQTGAILSTVTRKVSAAYDATGQEFANERARLDAENRAARELAEQLFAVIRVHLSGS